MVRVGVKKNIHSFILWILRLRRVCDRVCDKITALSIYFTFAYLSVSNNTSIHYTNQTKITSLQSWLILPFINWKVATYLTWSGCHSVTENTLLLQPWKWPEFKFSTQHQNIPTQLPFTLNQLRVAMVKQTELKPKVEQKLWTTRWIWSAENTSIAVLSPIWRVQTYLWLTDD